MTTTLRPYQATATTACIRHLHRGNRVCLVSPTGSGKTTMGAAVVAALGLRTVWLAHRDELITQAQERVPAGCEVMSYQTALSRGLPECDLVVTDEAHHLSETGDWRTVLPPGVPVLGLTATPQRGDGQPLGDVFDRMVVAAQYSELIADGHLVPCDVRAPGDARNRATVGSIVGLCESLPTDQRGFVFVASVEEAKAVARLLTGSRSVTAETPEDERRELVDSLRRGALRWLVNVATMTEGTDIPGATCAVVARPVGTAGLWLQMAGRVLRPAPGKTRATVYDLCGSVWTHGSPTADRAYSLRGEGIGRVTGKRSVSSVLVCLRCGSAYQGQPACPACDYRLARNSRGARVDLSQLVVAYAGAATTGVADQVEAWRREGMHWRQVRRRCRELFGTAPVIPWAPAEDRRAEYDRLVREAESTGKALGWAAHRYRGIFGSWPS